MSKPRAATTVAMRMGEVPWRKEKMGSSRSRWVEVDGRESVTLVEQQVVGSVGGLPTVRQFLEEEALAGIALLVPLHLPEC
jgi:hypothetical protein